MKQGDIWLVDYDPSVGHEYQKQRPAIVVMSTHLIKNAPLVAVMPITSSTQSAQKFDVPIKKTAYNNLHSDSVIKVQHISSFDVARFVKRIGVSSDIVLRQVKKYIPKHFDL